MAASETRKNRRRKRRAAEKTIGHLRMKAQAEMDARMEKLRAQVRAAGALRPVVVGAGGALAEQMKVTEASGRMLATTLLSTLVRFVGPVTVEVEGQEPVVVDRDAVDVVAMEAVHDFVTPLIAARLKDKDEPPGAPRAWRERRPARPARKK